MTALLMKGGDVVACNADIDTLAEYARKKGVKVQECSVLSYTNGYAVLNVYYSNRANGQFNGLSPGDLQTWACKQKGWPRPTLHNINIPWIIMAGEELPTEVVEAAPIAEPRRLTRVRYVEAPKRVTRTRR